MRIQNLAIIFIIIMLPIALVFLYYIDVQRTTIELQISYDAKLDNATEATIQAFQMNTANSSTSDIVNSKIRDIEAAANSFFTALATDFNVAGYNNETLKGYVPALVFTMYDGFYIYSPFENTLDEETANNLDQNPSAEYHAEEQVTGLKPYIYYSCRYKTGSTDVVITYSLDNYITIQGTANGKYISDAGYLINGITNIDEGAETLTYRGVTIGKEGALSEYIGGERFTYIKINGAKYYYDSTANGGSGDWFQVLNGERIYSQGSFNTAENDMAYRYYKEAADFRDRIFNEYQLGNLKASDAVDSNGQPLQALTDADGNVIYDFINQGNYKIFAYEENGISIEEPNSNFNQHRMAVIRYVIESNLSVALANYNSYRGNIEYNFQMPKLAEEDWDNILNNVSVISFLQGLSIGGKMYNGYSVINNNTNEEVVTENSIYITTTDGYFHKITSTELPTANNLDRGVFNIDFTKKNYYEDDGTIHYYHPQTHLGCYNCYVLQTSNTIVDNVYKYLDSISTTDTGKKVASLYYTALGRERYSTYKVFRNPEEHKNLFQIAEPEQPGQPEMPIEPEEPEVPGGPEDGTLVWGPYGLGDVNGDGVINETDASLIDLYIAHRYVLNSEEMLRADVNQDNLVNYEDSVQIRYYLSTNS